MTKTISANAISSVLNYRSPLVEVSSLDGKTIHEAVLCECDGFDLGLGLIFDDGLFALIGHEASCCEITTICDLDGALEDLVGRTITGTAIFQAKGENLDPEAESRTLMLMTDREPVSITFSMTQTCNYSMALRARLHDFGALGDCPFIADAKVSVDKTEDTATADNLDEAPAGDPRLRVYDETEIDGPFPSMGTKWTDEGAAELAGLWTSGAAMQDICAAIGRTPAAIMGRLARDGVIDADHPYAKLFAERAAQRAAQREEIKKAA